MPGGMAGIPPMLAAMVRAMGRSRIAPSLGRSAGARFTATRPLMDRPRERRAALTLSLDSFTAASGRPTTEIAKSPPVISASTSTLRASIPLRVIPQTGFT